MSDSSVYGAVIMVYMIPAAWLMMKQMDARESLEARKKLYPGRIFEDEENKYLSLNVIWGLGLAALLLGWKLEWPIVGGVLAMMGILGTSFWIKAKKFR